MIDPPTETEPAVTIESVWLVEATYAPDAAETRTPFRAEHLAGIEARKAAGTYVEAGAYIDVSSSLIIVRASDEAEAIAIVSDDVYMRNGVWVEVRARQFGRVIRTATGAV
ncbi:MAG: YciI family protein [Candidatus Limnocylindrales bacterium]